MYSRPVTARARRSADITASVPVDTNRTRSAIGTAAEIQRARCVSSTHGAPNTVPRATRRATRRAMRGSPCPTICAPHAHTKSTYSRPSASLTRAPLPLRIVSGVPPTDLNARTGEDTPPGMTFFAASKRRSLRVTMQGLWIPTCRGGSQTRPRAAGAERTSTTCVPPRTSGGGGGETPPHGGGPVAERPSRRPPVLVLRRDLAREVRDHDVRPGAADRADALPHREAPVDEVALRRGADHRVLAAHLIRGERLRRRRADLGDDVEVR